jgi:hypothetical protein
MSIFKLTNRLQYLNHLISKKCTGTPTQLAEKLGLSERGWYKLRDELVNDLELPIEYCNYRKSYQYTQEGNFEIGFKPLTDKQKENLSGGGVKGVANFAWKVYNWYRQLGVPFISVISSNCLVKLPKAEI